VADDVVMTSYLSG